MQELVGRVVEKVEQVSVRRQRGARYPTHTGWMMCWTGLNYPASCVLLQLLHPKISAWLWVGLAVEVSRLQLKPDSTPISDTYALNTWVKYTSLIKLNSTWVRKSDSNHSNSQPHLGVQHAMWNFLILTSWMRGRTKTTYRRDSQLRAIHSAGNAICNNLQG